MPDTPPRAGQEEVVYASDGAGPLLQRDYWAVYQGTGASPEEVAALVRARFVEFPPPETATFRRLGDARRPLEVGDEMAIRITTVGPCKVRVVHADRLSLTLRTLEDHPEAGRITFGAGRDDRGRVIFRIRSRARCNGWLALVGFLSIGKLLQTWTWIGFVRRLARASGGRVVGGVQIAERTVPDRMADQTALDAPTFVAKEHP